MAEVAKTYTFEEIKAEFTSRSRSVSPRKRQMTIPEEAQVTAKRVCLEEHAPHTTATSQQDDLVPCQQTQAHLYPVCPQWKAPNNRISIDNSGFEVVAQATLHFIAVTTARPRRQPGWERQGIRIEGVHTYATSVSVRSIWRIEIRIRMMR
jgi:hypothetical protein